MKPTATTAGIEDEVRLLFFTSGGERFAVDVAYVREILPGQTVTPVPFVPETVAGIINHRGTIYTLLRFSRLARLGEERGDGVVLLRLPEMAVGISVAQVEGIEPLPGRLLAGGGETAVVAEAPFLRRVIDSRGRLLHAVDAEKFVDMIYQLPELNRTGETERTQGQGAG